MRLKSTTPTMRTVWLPSSVANVRSSSLRLHAASAAWARVARPRA